MINRRTLQVEPCNEGLSQWSIVLQAIYWLMNYRTGVQDLSRRMRCTHPNVKINHLPITNIVIITDCGALVVGLGLILVDVDMELTWKLIIFIGILPKCVYNEETPNRYDNFQCVKSGMKISHPCLVKVITLLLFYSLFAVHHVKMLWAI